MNRVLKQRIKRLWRDRFLVSIGSLAVLGFSVLQLQTVLRHRPSGTFVLEESVAIFVDEKSSTDEKKNALRELQNIAQKYNLQIAASLAGELNRARVLDLDLELNSELDRTLDWALDLNLARTRSQDANLDLDLEQDLEIGLNQVQYIVQKLHGDTALSQHQTLSQELIYTLEQIQPGLQNSLIVPVLLAELEQQHGLEFEQGNLAKLRRKDSIRTQAFFRSGILLTISLLVLSALIFMLSRLLTPYNLAPNSHLTAFLPEECVGELSILQQRMKKKNASIWQIRLRLLQEFLILLWVFYIQIQIDNLGLPPGDRSTDD